MILLACLLTVAVETAFLAAFGYRDRYALTVIVCANIVTNLLLNLLLWLLGWDVGAWIYLFEALVVAAEYAVYAAAFRPGWKLFFLTLAANCISYGLGLLVFR